VEAEGPPEPAQGDPAVLDRLRDGRGDPPAGHQVRVPLGGLDEPTGIERVLYVDAVYGTANIGTFLLRFLFFHYVLFAASVVKDPPGAAEEALASTDPGPEPFARAAEPDSAAEDDEDFER